MSCSVPFTQPLTVIVPPVPFVQETVGFFATVTVTSVSFVKVSAAEAGSESLCSALAHATT